MSDKVPTKEQVRAARHTGFVDTVSSMDKARQRRLADAYRPQDARRESNIGGFYDSVQRGGRGS